MSDAELMKRLRSVLREVNAQSKLFPSKVVEDTVDIPDDEVVLLILNAADRRVAALESQLLAASTTATTTSIANDPAAVLRKSGITTDEEDDDRDAKRLVVTTKTNGSSHSQLRPPVQRSTSALVLPRTRGATVSSAAPTTSAAVASTASSSTAPKLEIIGAGLSTAVVGRVASFVVRFVAADGKLKHVANKSPTAVFHAPDGVDVAANVTKCRDGSFALSYAVPAAANADAAGTLDVFINGQRSKLSPYTIQLSARRAT